MSKQASGSFLKKGTKKLLVSGQFDGGDSSFSLAAGFAERLAAASEKRSE